MNLNERSRGLLIVIIGVLAFVPDSLFIKLVQTDTLNLAFWRSLSAGGVIILVLTLVQKTNPLAGLSKSGWPGFVYLVLMATSSLLFVLAIRTTSVANTLFILSTSPLFAAIASRILLHEPLSRSLIIAIGLSLVGIGFITGGSMTLAGNQLAGDILALLVAIMLAVKHTVARKAKAFSMVPFAGLAHLMLAFGLLIFAEITIPDVHDMAYILILGSIFIPIATSLMALGPRYLPAPEVALILLLEAILAPLLVWLVLGEQPTLIALIGGMIVVSVLAVYNYCRIMRV